MAKQTINIGSSANDGTGTSLRDGGDLINDNFNEIYNIIGDGSTLSLSSLSLTTPAIDTITRTGNFTIDASANIILDADGGNWTFKDNATNKFLINVGGGSQENINLNHLTSDGFLNIKGIDGGSEITALCFNMSDAGAARFNANVSVGTLTVRGGHVIFPGQIIVSDVINASNGLTTDNLTIVNGGNEIDVSSGNLTLDVAGKIVLDADDGSNGVQLHDGGTEFLRFSSNGIHTDFYTAQQDGDITIKQNDGGSTISTVTFDASHGGNATFNGTIATTGLTINSAYTFPTADGSANQVLQTDGSGTLSFATASGVTDINGLTDGKVANSCSIGLGTNALLNVSTGLNNTALGYNSACSITSTSCNTAIGTNALRVNTSCNNTVVGNDAMCKATGGQENVVIGNQAFHCAQAGGTSNVIVGDRAACKTTGSGGFNNNVMVGALAGYETCHGCFNVFIGRGAGGSFPTPHCGSNNIIIGYAADMPSSTASNSIVLGNSSISTFSIPGLQSSGSSGDVMNYDGTSLVLGKVSSTNLASSVSLQIIDSSGSVLKTIHGAGS